MRVLEKLGQIWAGIEYPYLIHGGHEIRFSETASQASIDLSLVKSGDTVALIGDFERASILTLLQLIDLGAIIVPLTVETAHDHEYFFETALVDLVIRDGEVRRRTHHQAHDLITELRAQGHAGLVLFSTGTTDRPKAILHDLTRFLKRFETPRPALRTISFLLFDHVGGMNTLLHTLFNRGVIIVPEARTVDSVLDACFEYGAEVLPATPTFLRMMLLSGAVPGKIPACLKIITYGTERMDQATLSEYCRLLPNVDFRQTYGTSELGIVRVKSAARDSLFMKVGGEGVETRVVDSMLHIRSASRMLGYLNAPSPFDAHGWYDTRDVVEEQDGCYRIMGRTSDVINVGGLKFMASAIERVVLDFPGVLHAKAYPGNNPITGQHVELTVEPSGQGMIDKNLLVSYLKSELPSHMVPRRVRIGEVAVSHRFKKQ